MSSEVKRLLTRSLIFIIVFSFTAINIEGICFSSKINFNPLIVNSSFENRTEQPATKSHIFYPNGFFYGIEFQSIHIKEKIAFLACENDGLLIVNVTNITNPIILSSYDGGLHSRAIFAHGDYVYVGYGHGLDIMDISNISAPVKIAEFNLTEDIIDIYVKDTFAYICSYDDGFVILDVSDPFTPVSLSGVSGFVFDLYIRNNFAYIVDRNVGLKIYDISNPSVLVKIGEFSGEDFTDISVSGDYAYISSNDGLVVLNIEDPSNIFGGLQFSAAGYSRTVEARENYVFSGFFAGFRIFDVHESMEPAVIYSEAIYDIRDLSVANGYVYMATYGNGLFINAPDTDQDTILDYVELDVYGTNPYNSDSDNDGLDDSYEIDNSWNPLDPTDPPFVLIDTDEDGITDIKEENYGTDPELPDTDYDLLSDFQELFVFGTNATLSDTDQDILLDGEEILGIYSPRNHGANSSGYVHTNPFLPDSDSDGYTDFEEISSHSDPNDPFSIPSDRNWTTIYIIIGVLAFILIITFVYVVLSIPKWKSNYKERRIKSIEDSSEIDSSSSSLEDEEELNKWRIIKLQEIIKNRKTITIIELGEKLRFNSVLETEEWLITVPNTIPFKIDGTNVVQIQSELKESPEKIVYSHTKSKTCYYCGFPLEKSDTICPTCKEDVLICIVCNLPIVIGEDVGKCALCETRGHLKHLQEWVKTQGHCSHCLQKIPVEGIILEEIDDKKGTNQKK